ncbi:MAG TPA: hypothetical protein VGT82_14435 [Ktedonobacteraceae bacterium]|nr:hypothetical protein [Ktedonobacteraceae bacterium]
MPALTDLIAAYIDRWHNPYLLKLIFNSADPASIAQRIDTFCHAEMGSPLDETVFFAASQGLVFGVRLRDGRRIVIKVHKPGRAPSFLSGVGTVQRYLADAGYPCPHPLLGPRPCGQGLAMVEDLIDEGVYHDAHDAVYRRSLAEMLAWLIRLTRHPETIPGLNPSVLDLRLPSGVLWPTPHSNIFDFEATWAGAEWIDEIALSSKAIIDMSVGELVIGHGDWSIKHIRYVGERVRVIYDWDSLTLNKEPVLVGQSAVGFTYTEFFPVAWFPSAEEARAFVNEYEETRGKPFNTDERKMLAAAATYGLAYAARCEYSLHPQEQVYPANSARALLARYGESFITFD